MDSTHGFIGITAASVAPALVYLTHWPLQPLSLDSATPLTSLLISLAGVLIMVWRAAHPAQVIPVPPNGH